MQASRIVRKRYALIQDAKFAADASMALFPASGQMGVGIVRDSTQGPLTAASSFVANRGFEMTEKNCASDKPRGTSRTSGGSCARWFTAAVGRGVYHSPSIFADSSSARPFARKGALS